VKIDHAESVENLIYKNSSTFTLVIFVQTKTIVECAYLLNKADWKIRWDSNRTEDVTCRDIHLIDTNFGAVMENSQKDKYLKDASLDWVENSKFVNTEECLPTSVKIAITIYVLIVLLNMERIKISQLYSA
jgi:hypothetical protein